MRFFRNAASILLTQAAGMPLGLLTSIVLARFLSTDDRGLYAVATSFAAVVAMLVQLGWGSGAIYRLRRVGTDPREVAGAALIACLVLAAVAIGIALPLQPWVSARFLDGAPAAVFFVAIAVVPFQLLGTVFGSIARGLDRFSLLNGYQFSVAALMLIALVLALVVGGGGLDAALTALLCVQAVATAGLLAAVLRATGRPGRAGAGELRETLRYGSQSHAQNLAGYLHERIDIFMLAFLLQDGSLVAIYTIAVGVIRFVKVVPDAIGKALFPKLAGDAPEDAASFVAYASRHSLMWVLVVALALGVAAPVLIPLFYGDSYRASIPVFWVLLPGMAMLTVYKVFARYFMALGEQRVNIVAQVLGVALNVGLNWLLIPRLGVLGAAIASLISYGVAALVVAVAFLHRSGKGLRESFVLRSGDLETYTRRIEALRGRAV